LFVVEGDARLQDVLRDKFKELGYRVLLSVDPVKALDRFRLQPFDALIVDAGTTGKDSTLFFERVLAEAERTERFCAGVLILSEDQADLAQQVPLRKGATVLVRPVGVKQLQRTLQQQFQNADEM
jgi:DNA-binding response OmpR family regulator